MSTSRLATSARISPTIVYRFVLSALTQAASHMQTLPCCITTVASASAATHSVRTTGPPAVQKCCTAADRHSLTCDPMPAIFECGDHKRTAEDSGNPASKDCKAATAGASACTRV